MASQELEQALLELARCFLEGPEAPPPRVKPPKTFRLRVWQVIQELPKKSALHVTIAGLPKNDFEEVEVIFEGDETEDVAPQDWDGAELKFDLPDRWVQDPGPRLVTVYIREKKAAAAGKKLKKAQEAPKTIIRIIPASVASDVASDFDELEPARNADD